jgi:hypothetical protein
MMNCQDYIERLVEYSLDQLDAASAAQVRAHLGNGCPQCTAALAEIQAAWETFANHHPPVEPAPQLAEDLFARIETERRTLTAAHAEAATAIAPDGALPRRRWMAALLGLAAALLGVVAFPLVERSMPPGHRSTEFDSPEDGWGGRPGDGATLIRPVVLVSNGRPREPAVSAVWDVAANQWHFFALRLPPTAPNECYQLWLENQVGEFTSAAAFRVDQFGTGGAVVDLPQDVSSIRGIRVTLESAEGAAQPMGPVHFSADIGEGI